MPDFKNDHDYTTTEQAAMEKLLADTNVRTKLKDQKQYILIEIAVANNEYLKSLDIDTKQSILTKISSLSGDAKTAFERYTTKLGFSDCATRDDTKIGAIDPGFWVACSQALTIQCCEQMTNLTTSVVNRKKNPGAVDGRFGPNTIFAMNEVFKKKFSGKSFNGLLSDGDGANSLLGSLINTAIAPAASKQTNTDTSTAEATQVELTDKEKSFNFTHAEKLLIGISDLYNKPTKCNALLTLLKEKDNTTNNSILVTALSNMLTDTHFTIPTDKSQQDFLTGLKAHFLGKKPPTTDEKALITALTTKIDAFPAESATVDKETTNFITHSGGVLTLMSKKATFDNTNSGQSMTQDAFDYTIEKQEDLEKITIGSVVLLRHTVVATDGNTSYTLMTKEGQGIELEGCKQSTSTEIGSSRSGHLYFKNDKGNYYILKPDGTAYKTDKNENFADLCTGEGNLEGYIATQAEKDGKRTLHDAAGKIITVGNKTEFDEVKKVFSDSDGNSLDDWEEGCTVTLKIDNVAFVPEAKTTKDNPATKTAPADTEEAAETSIFSKMLKKSVPQAIQDKLREKNEAEKTRLSTLHKKYSHGLYIDPQGIPLPEGIAIDFYNNVDIRAQYIDKKNFIGQENIATVEDALKNGYLYINRGGSGKTTEDRQKFTSFYLAKSWHDFGYNSKERQNENPDQDAAGDYRHTTGAELIKIGDLRSIDPPVQYTGDIQGSDGNAYLMRLTAHWDKENGKDVFCGFDVKFEEKIEDTTKTTVPPATTADSSKTSVAPVDTSKSPVAPTIPGVTPTKKGGASVG